MPPAAEQANETCHAGAASATSYVDDPHGHRHPPKSYTSPKKVARQDVPVRHCNFTPSRGATARVSTNGLPDKNGAPMVKG